MKMENISDKEVVALVLGGHVNGYSIIKELYEQGITNIALFDKGSSIARCSNKVTYRAVIDSTSNSLLTEINKLKELYGRIVIFPTDDYYLEKLSGLYNQISAYCYLPFNQLNLLDSLNKNYQYEKCAEISIPYPQTMVVDNLDALSEIADFTFPILIKPTTRKDLHIDIFRNLYLNTPDDFLKEKDRLLNLVTNGVELLCSEFIPGDDTNIFAYTCFRSQEGNILNSWVGKKLTQYPDNYGVFCSASNEAPDIVKEQGEKLVDALNLYGIAEPEFKYDCRDGKYKLMEINLRSMMWHRTGNISGVKLLETQFNYAINKPVIKYEQQRDFSIHYVLMMHEIPNLIARKGYWKHFKYNLWGGDIRKWAVFEWLDIKPFFYSIISLIKKGVKVCLKQSEKL